jgi:peptidoglycan/xylan/chitin deacetylase (PgdA/CDA1 family)
MHETRYAISPSRLEEMLGYLHMQRYRLWTFAEYASGSIDATLGPSVVLTFDDSTADQFRALPDGTIDPACALGVLERFASEHPGYRVTATFFVNAGGGQAVFGQPAYALEKLRYLVERGYEIGSHGAAHLRYGEESAVAIEDDLSRCERALAALLPLYRVRSFAYPYGNLPGREGRAVVERRYSYTARAWGGVASGIHSADAPRIEIGPETTLARYAPSLPSEMPREAGGNVYKEMPVLAAYARNHP